MLSIAVDDYFQVKLGLVLTEGRRIKVRPLQVKQSHRHGLARQYGPRLGRILTLIDHEIDQPSAFGSEISLKGTEVTMFLPKEK